MQLFNEGVTRIVAGNGLGAIIHDVRLRYGEIVGPGADVFGRIWRDGVKPCFEQYALPQIFDGRGDARIREPNAAAEQICSVEGSIACHLHNAIYADCPDEPIVEFTTAFDMRELGVVAACLDVKLGWRLDPDVDILGKTMNDLIAF